MKKSVFFIAILGLLLSSCGAGDYPDITYTNKLDVTIEFTTAEKDSPAYKLGAAGSAGSDGEPGDSITLSSDVPGRTEIRTIKTASGSSASLFTWEYREKTNKKADVYKIQFVMRKNYKLDILNFADFDVVVSEKSGLLEVPFITVAAAVMDTGTSEPEDPEADPPEAGPGRTSTKVYTTQPVFLFSNAPDIQFKLRKNNNDFMLGINPPGGNWWE